MSGMRLKNTSRLTLEGGALTVIEGDAYAGEALIERLKPAEERFISFAVDLATLVAVKKNGGREPVFLVLARIGGWVFEAMASAAVIVVVSERYMGREVTAGQALQRVWARIGTVFVTSFIYGLIVFVGFVLLIVPGFYFACKYFAMMPAVVIEGLDSSTSQKRSSNLTHGSKWRVLGLIVVAWVIYFVLLAIVASAVGPTMHGMTGIVVTRLLVVPIYPFLGILVTLLYYDLRIRNEGLDLDLMLANETPAQPASA